MLVESAIGSADRSLNERIYAAVCHVELQQVSAIALLCYRQRPCAFHVRLRNLRQQQDRNALDQRVPMSLFTRQLRAFNSEREATSWADQQWQHAGVECGECLSQH